MTADSLFRLCNSTALAGWVLLVVTGWSPRASRVISSLITGLLVPALLCGLYLMLIATHWSGHRGGFNSLSNVMLLFTDRWLVLAGWVPSTVPTYVVVPALTMSLRGFSAKDT